MQYKINVIFMYLKKVLNLVIFKMDLFLITGLVIIFRIVFKKYFFVIFRVLLLASKFVHIVDFVMYKIYVI